MLYESCYSMIYRIMLQYNCYYIYIYIERERDTCMCVYIYIYIYTYIHTYNHMCIILLYYSIAVCPWRKRPSEEEHPLEDRLLEHQIRGWRAAFAAGLQDQGSRKGRPFFRHRWDPSLASSLGLHPRALPNGTDHEYPWILRQWHRVAFQLQMLRFQGSPTLCDSS